MASASSGQDALWMVCMVWECRPSCQVRRWQHGVTILGSVREMMLSRAHHQQPEGHVMRTVEPFACKAFLGSGKPSQIVGFRGNAACNRRRLKVR